ncbi:MAG: hypothetical protein NTY77_05430 [Elusimicrobia bacterium]|nr:hypothetical protein [Elusimicrobiota bacterium]
MKISSKAARLQLGLKPCQFWKVIELYKVPRCYAGPRCYTFEKSVIDALEQHITIRSASEIRQLADGRRRLPWSAEQGASSFLPSTLRKGGAETAGMGRGTA